MILVMHLLFVLISFVSLLVAIAGKFKTGQAQPQFIKITGISSAGVIVTGVALVIAYQAEITGACLAGSVYLTGIVTLYGLYRKLATSRL